MLANVSAPAAGLMIRGLLLLAILITVISMVTLDLSGDPVDRPPAGGGTINETNGPEEPNGENGEENPDPTPPPEDQPPTPEPPAQAVTSVEIDWRFRANNVNEMTIHIGDILDVWVNVFPVDADVDVHWETANVTVAGITVNPENHREIQLEARGTGQTMVTVTAGGQSAELIVRVR